MGNRLLLVVLLVLAGGLSYAQPGQERKLDSVLGLVHQYVFKVGEEKADLDRAAGFLEEARRLNMGVKSRIAEGRILLEGSFLARERKEVAQGRQELTAAIAILEKERNDSLLGTAYLALADYFDLNNAMELPDRMRAFKKAIVLFEKGGHVEQEAYTYKMLAETDSSDVTTEQELDKALALYRSIGYPQLQGVYDLYTGLNIYRSNFPEALKWGLKALKTAEAVGDSTMQLCAIKNHIAIVYRHGRDTVNALRYFSEALKVAERFNDKTTIYLLTMNIAGIYLDQQLPGSAGDLLRHIEEKYGAPDKRDVLSYCRFVEMSLKVSRLSKKFASAEKYYRQLSSMEDNFHFESSDLSNMYVAILEYLLESGRYEDMLPYLKKDEVAANAYGNPRNIARLHQLWFCYDTSQHDYKSAVAHLLDHDKLSNSIHSRESDRLFKELQVRYETEKKEAEIAFLNKQSRLEKANLKQAMLVKDLTVAGIIAVVFIAALLYRQSRLRQKTNVVISQKNEQLQGYLSEKEWLLKEIHHRVKNNLQIVMSLLNTQSAYIDNGPALSAIHDSQHRVHAMSLIHQKLYSSANLATINMPVYIRELVSYLADCYGVGSRVYFDLAVDRLEMDVEQVVPLGLILNEAITNSIKYAFPDGCNGVIAISLAEFGPHRCLLTISDNGVGLPDRLNTARPGSLGMQLMQGLAGDLDGTFTIESRNGTTIRIAFEYEPAQLKEA